MKLPSKCVHAGQTPDPTTGAIIPPIYQTATYVLPQVGRDLGFDYTRSSNPTRQVLETNLAALESGKYGICFASGMSAVDAVLKLLKSDEHVVCSDDVYGGVLRHFDQVLTDYGLQFTYIDSTDPRNIENAIRPNTRLIWLETPSNPLIKITDIKAAVKIGKAANIPVGVDSTFATPIFLRPLELGADIVMHSTTKYISGHNQIIGGALAVNRQDLYDRFKFIQKTIGAVNSPFDSWLTLLGIKTLHLRMHRHADNALRIAKFLEAHAKVARVSYPGLPSHPQHAIAKREMSGYSGMLSFELKGGITAGRKLMNALKLCALAESLGSVETMITHPATMTHVDVPPAERHARGLTDGLVRLSVGIEHPDDIEQDLAQALSKT